MNIKEVSERLDIPKETLRYWENSGLIPEVPRNASGYRNYTENEIKSAQPDQILLRNARKSENINRNCLMGKVWGSVPYRAYYMSANLDHVLYDKLNSSDKDKENDAFLFAKRYKDRLDDFLQFIADSEFSVVGDFKDSWEFIKEGKHSLERHTNLGICFKEIREERMANSCDSD